MKKNKSKEKIIKRVEDLKKISKTKSEITTLDLWRSITKNYGEISNEEGRKESIKIILSFLKQEVYKNPVAQNYNILILFDNTSLIKSDADRIYNAVTAFTEKKPLLLILYSRGGSAESAYLIGKLCEEYAYGSFVISVPRHAKSAATLICCAANEIHMGSLSELGPIDPQIGDFPALGLKNSIEHIAELVKIYPESSDMFSKYLGSSLKLINLGYYERVAESAKQYAEKLLRNHKTLLLKSPTEIAYELVYKYKDHGFVIDKTEATEIFGDKVVKKNTPEYNLGNTMYKNLDTISYYLKLKNYFFCFIGSLDSDPIITKKTVAET